MTTDTDPNTTVEENAVVDTAPVITLGGKQWSVPSLAPRQMREIYADVIDISRIIDETPGDEYSDKVIKLSNEQYGRVCKVVFHGLTRGTPELTYDEFLDMPITPPEMVWAFLFVRHATGMFAPVKPTEKAA